MDLPSILLFVFFSFVNLTVEQAPLEFTSWPSVCDVGQTYTITWSGGQSDQPVTLVLRQGDPGDLVTVATITELATGGSYQWTLSTSIPSGSNYALEITQGTDVNYSGEFTIQGASTSVAAGGVVDSSPVAAAGSQTSSSMHTSTPSTLTGTTYSSQTLATSITGQTSATSSAGQNGGSPSTNTNSQASSTDSTTDSTTSLSTSSSTPAPTSNTSNLSSPASTGLSAGDKAAIGIAVPFGLFLFGTAALFLQRFLKRQHPSESSNAVESKAIKSELDGNEIQVQRAELPIPHGQPNIIQELP